MNREKIIKLINQSQDKELDTELSYFMEIDREYEYDLSDALNDAYDFAENSNDRKIIKAIRLIYIEAGYFKPSPEKTDFGRDTRMTVNKIKYQVAGGWDGWINE